MMRPTPQTAELSSLRATSTFAIVSACVIAFVFADPGGEVNALFAVTAYIVGCGVAAGVLIEARGGIRNLIRVDLFMIGTLYLLTLLEFLLPQPSLSQMVSTENAASGVYATLLGFIGLAVGRQFVPMSPAPPGAMRARRFEPNQLFWLFLASAALGYLHMFLAVGFDPFEVVRQLLRPRFSQPWTRGQLGGLSTLLNELGLLIYLLPPLAGAMLASRQRFTFLQQTIVGIVLAFTFFQGLAGGTRNIILTYLVTFLTAYLLLVEVTLKRVLVVGVPIVLVAAFATIFLPEIRTVGWSKFDLDQSATVNLFVDYNLVNISNLTNVFPDRYPYLGLEIPFTALIRPIPRALWPGKPEGLSITIENALGAEGMTLATAFIGEFYMAGGYFAVIIGALLFGAAAAGWNNFGSRATTTLHMIAFASGFFAAGICMRSFLSVAPAILPTLALWMYVRTFITRLPQRVERIMRR